MPVLDNNNETTETKPHDAVVRRVLSDFEHAREFLGLLLPDDLHRWFDLATVRIENPVTFARRGEERIIDLLISVRGREVTDDQRKDLLVVVEHKSSHDSNTVGQMYEYILRVREQFPDEWLFPAVLYHGRRLKFTHPLEHDDMIVGSPQPTMQLIGDHVLRLRFKCRLLNLHDWQVQQDARGLRIEPLIYILVHIWALEESDVERVMGIDPGYGHASRIKVMGPVMEYIMSVKSDYNWERFIEIEARVIASEEDRIMARLMTLEEAQRDRGWQEGRQEGVQEGMQIGRQEEKSEIAGNMIRAGVDDKAVADYTGLSDESVADLKRKLNGA